MKRRLWVVELKCRTRWVPMIADVATTKRVGLRLLTACRRLHVSHEFRLTCYLASRERGK